MLEQKEKFNKFNNIESGISERERELSEKSLKIFNNKWDSIEKLDRPEKIGDIKIIKQADAIIYQSNETKDEHRNFCLPFEIGIGDPSDREENFIHLDIKQEVEKKLQTKIIKRTSGLIFEDEKSGLNFTIDTDWHHALKECFGEDKKILEYFQKMLERYGIKKLWVGGEEEGKEMSNILERLVWDAQSSAYAEKKGMTNTDFLRWRLIGCKLGEEGKEE